MLLQRIQQHFIDSADLKYQAAQAMAPAVEAAVGAVLACVTSGGKVMTCGSGVSASLAQAFAAFFVGRFERERPELAALALSANAAVLTGPSAELDGVGIFARQVRALGQPGDVLLLVTSLSPTPDILAAVDAAHERDMMVVALCAAKAGAMSALLRDTDVLVSAPTERQPRIHEMHQLALHCICDGVDVQLLGDDAEPEMEP